MDAAPPFRLGYRPALDGVRAVAILLVLFYHFGSPWVPAGWVGVDVFFVLSGFLITALLSEEAQRTGRIDLRRFYLRRALRLFPALFALTLLLVAFALIVRSRYTGEVLQEALATILYSMNWFKAYRVLEGNVLGYTWSLSIEEQFYLVWPVVLLGLMGSDFGRRRILAVVVLGIVASAGARAAHWFAFRDYARVYFGLDTRADALLVGCLLGLLAARGRLPASRGWRAAAWPAFAGILALAWAPVSEDVRYSVGMPLLNACAAVLIVALLSDVPSPLRRFFELAPIVWIGRVSYGIYLWQWPVRNLFLKLGWDGRSWTLPAECAASIAAAALSYYALEIHFLRLKKRAGGSTSLVPDSPERS